MTVYRGRGLVNGEGAVEILNASGVQWSFEEVR